MGSSNDLQIGADDTDDSIEDVAIRADGALYAVGTTTGNLDGNHDTPHGSDGFVTRVSSGGEPESYSQFGTLGDERFSRLAISASGR